MALVMITHGITGYATDKFLCYRRKPGEPTTDLYLTTNGRWVPVKWEDEEAPYVCLFESGREILKLLFTMYGSIPVVKVGSFEVPIPEDQ
jgi:hypothetical protein